MKDGVRLRVTRGINTVLAYALLYLILSGLCVVSNLIATSDHRRFKSPNGDREAVLFIRDGGATTNFSSHVTIQRAGRWLPRSIGNAFVYEGHYGEDPSGSDAQVTVSWISNEVLVVRYRDPQFVIKAEQFVEGVRIDYGPLE